MMSSGVKGRRLEPLIEVFEVIILINFNLIFIFFMVQKMYIKYKITSIDSKATYNEKLMNESFNKLIEE